MIIGRSVAIRRALSLADRYARTRIPIVLVGATGTGKEVFAQYIHRLSGRSGLFVDVNCCALPREMVESLLFGHRRGAFTGAVESSVGHVERSDGGTLFLDELGSLAPDTQGKLLRVLETDEVQPLGAMTKRRIDLRLVSAAQEGIGSALESGRFRRDLFQRVAGLVIELPPLAERPEDVLPLAEHFAGARRQRLAPGVEHVLLNYVWPGNARELRMVIDRAGELADNGTITSAGVAEAIALGLPGSTVARCTNADCVERTPRRDELVALLERHGWDWRLTAEALGVGRTTLFKRLKTLGISLRAKPDPIGSQSSL